MFFQFSVHLVHFNFIAFGKQDIKQDAWKFYDSLCKRSKTFKLAFISFYIENATGTM